MNSPILEYLSSMGIDPAYLMIGLFVIVIILIILYIRTLGQLKKLYRKYDRFMRGKDMESMEETVWKQFDRIEALEKSDQEKQEVIERILENLQNVYQKTGLVKYDAFNEMAGKLSFVIALLNNDNSGIVLNAMHSREGCFTYAKEIIKGESFIPLSEEEKQALEQAKTVEEEINDLTQEADVEDDINFDLYDEN